MSDHDADSRCYSYQGSDSGSWLSGEDQHATGPSLFNLNEAENSLKEREEQEHDQLTEKSEAFAKVERGLKLITTMASLPPSGLPFECRYSLPESGLFLNNVQLTFSIMESPDGSISKQRMNQLRRGIQRMLNMDLHYDVTFSHGLFTWTVSRKFNHWRRLYPLLRASGILPIMGQQPKHHLPIENASRVQNRRDSTVSTNIGGAGEDLARRSRFEHQLKKILDKLDHLDRNLNLLKFLAVSRLSFVRGIGGKGAEAEVQVYVQRYASPMPGCDACYGCCARKKTRWMVIKDMCIIFLKDNLSEPTEVFLLDKHSLIVNGLDPSMREYLCGFVLRNANMLVVAKCDYTDYPMLARELGKFQDNVQHASASQTFNKNSNHQSKRRHHSMEEDSWNSFGNTHKHCSSKWYVDGATYFADIFDALEQANEEIFIADWWLTPELHLKRPDDGYHQLMKVLERRANLGVHVYILLYKEVKYTLNIDSWYSKLMLRTLNRKNIHIMRHPDHLASWEFLWAHHEKLVIVDQKLAFVGGLDLCYGRWDTQQHHIVDNGDDNWQKYPPLIPVLTAKCRAQATAATSCLATVKVHQVRPTNADSRCESNLALESDSQFASPFNSQLNSPDSSPELDRPQSAAARSRQKRHQQRRNSDTGCDASAAGGGGGMDKISEVSDDSGQASGCPITQREVALTAAGGGEEDEEQRAAAAAAASKSAKRKLRRLFSTNNERDVIIAQCLSHSHNNNHNHNHNHNHMLSASQPASSLKHHFDTIELSPIEPSDRQIDDNGNTLVANTPDAKRLRDGQIQIKHHDPVMMRMGNFLRSSRQKRRVERNLRERLRRDETRPLTDADPNYAIRPDEFDKIRMWKGKDYVNWMLKEPIRLHRPDEELIDRNQTPRMPWHDIGCVVGGNAARDVARHFIERWNFTVKNKNKRNGHDLPMLIPKSMKSPGEMPDNAEFETAAAAAAAAKKKKPERKLLRNFFSNNNNNNNNTSSNCNCSDVPRPTPLTFKSIAPKFANRVTVLRSLGMWSGGLEQAEMSIYEAMCDAIDSAQHYIYIENQFFISNTCSDSSAGKLPANNQIAYRLVQRIIRAHTLQQLFRVFIILPLMPQFEGNIAESGSSGEHIKKILHHTYECLCRGDDSVIGQLAAAGIDYNRYLSICSLRTWGKLDNGQLCTELIYVHSKLLICDDRVAIIGSANINDRSLLGYRDSELAIRFEDIDTDLVPSEWQCGPIMVGSFCSSLRRCLMREHLGVVWSEPKDHVLADPVSDELWQLWLSTAKANTQIYEEIFHCYPTDRVANYRELRQWIEEAGTAGNARELALLKLEGDVHGFLVQFPLQFLSEVNLDFPVGRITRASLVPLITWL